VLDKNTEESSRYLQEPQHFLQEGMGYQWIQGTSPQTLFYGLTDSPVGLAAGIVEKFYTWCDCQGDVDACFGSEAVTSLPWSNLMCLLRTSELFSVNFDKKRQSSWPPTGSGTIESENQLKL